MEIDPVNYDVDELRELFGGDSPAGRLEAHTEEDGFLWPSKSQHWALGIEDPTAEQHKWLLKLLDGADRSTVESKPYLQAIPEGESARGLVLDWLEFLAETAGSWGAIDALSRYREIGWVTPAVEQDLRDHMLGVRWRDGDGYEALDTADHLLSFAYVVKLVTLA
ncbi:FlaD/FlaE family flagellar protein [Natrinema gelatinilyticum]|uniref:FlaD/FlaE family flagellar protein n=1 Tax=Natrinema gelatinilyticum TaxID=2961571 RepID=UPI0020C2D073|nr:FlaD/FlaE family flagellar protein [Natrinema gelatinilyticum]